MKRYLLTLMVVIPTMALTQQDTAKPPTFGWTHSLVAGLTGTQISFSNWSQGGENALAYTFSLEGKSAQDQESVNWTSEYKFGYGQARLGSQGLRKTDDKIDIGSVVTFKRGWPLNPYASATLKTQISRGYTFSNAGTSTAVSDFFDPAYLMQTIGMGYMPIPEVKLRFGGGAREIIASQFAPLYTDDPATPALEKTKFNAGLEFVADVNWKIAENIELTSKLELFDAFKKMDQVIVRNDNSLSMKISKYIVTIVNVQLINERQITPRTQVKQTLALGITYTLI